MFRFISHESLNFRRLLRPVNPSGRERAEEAAEIQAIVTAILPIKRLAHTTLSVTISQNYHSLTWLENEIAKQNSCGFTSSDLIMVSFYAFPLEFPLLHGFCEGPDILDIMIFQPKSILPCEQYLPLK